MKKSIVNIEHVYIDSNGNVDNKKSQQFEKAYKRFEEKELQKEKEKEQKYLNNKDKIDKLWDEYDKNREKIKKYKKTLDKRKKLDSEHDQECLAVWEPIANKLKIKRWLIKPYGKFREKKLHNAVRDSEIKLSEAHKIIDIYNNQIITLTSKQFPIIRKKYKKLLSKLLTPKVKKDLEARNSLIRENEQIEKRITKLGG